MSETTNKNNFVAGEPLTTNNAREILPELSINAIDRRIVKIRPSSTPIDQISRLGGSRHCGAMTVDYYSVDTKKTESAAASDSEADDMVDKNGCKSFKLQVEDPTIFEVSETVLFPNAKGDDGNLLVGYIIANDTSTGLEIVPVNGRGTDGIYSGDPIVRMGRAATELDMQTPQFQALPTRLSNQCQIFKMQVEQSTLQRMADKTINWTLSDQEEAAIIDMRMGMEKSFLFGQGAKIYDYKKNEYVYLTRGIWNQAEVDFKVNVNNLTHGDLIDLCAAAFTQNNGSKNRILVAGTGLMTAISKLPADRTVDVRDPHAKWGLEAREIVTNFGHLFLIHSEVFDQCGHYNDGFVLDPEYITKYTHIPFNVEQLDLRKSGTRNTDAVVLTEASCLVLRYPKSHLRVVNTN